MSYRYSDGHNTSSISVKSCGISALANEYDFYFYPLGYESRCTHLADCQIGSKGRKFAISFDYSQQLSFAKNMQRFSEIDVDVIEWSPPEIENKFESLLQNFSADRECKIFLDVSSFSRLFIAHFISSFSYISQKFSLRIAVTFGYTEAIYNAPGEDGPIQHAGPVTPDFAGWPRDPTLPTECIIGLGYEEGRALGALEYIEPNSTCFFRPLGSDQRYLQALNSANHQLYEYAANAKIIDYKLRRPYTTFLLVESLVVSYIEQSRPVLVPFGPKMFFVIAALVAMRNSPYVSLWRVSAGELDKPVDRKASGEYSFLAAKFIPSK